MQNLSLAAPIDRWDEAIPLGNGLMGTLLWGGGNQLKLSLDRGDLWDLRPEPRYQQPDWTWATLKRLVAEGKQDQIVEMFDKPYNNPYPTKIPAGRIELTLSKSAKVEAFALDLQKAVGGAKWRGGSIQVFCSADAPVGLALVRGSTVKARIVPPAFGGAAKLGMDHQSSAGELGTLGYPAPTQGQAGSIQWSHQQSTGDFAFAMVMGVKKVAGGTLIAYAVTCTNDGPDPVAIGQERVAAALAAGFSRMLKPHVQWWKGFWSRSNVTLPDAAIQQHYEMVQYFYGSASRRGAPPIPLQGVWTADEGRLPPWKGDYHHDLNTQLTYWAYLTSDHLDEGLCFLDYLWNLLPRARQFAREFYGAPGACVPGVAALDGQPLAGWSQYTVVPANSMWLAHAFYLHWRHTMDRTFLQERAYPWCAEVGQCVEAMLEPGADGKLKLPLSASPEFFDNSLKAWMTPNSNYDLALLRWMFGALAEMAGELGKADEATHWRAILDRLDDFAIAEDGMWTGALLLAPGQPLTESHRHFSHLLGVHPLGLITIDGGEREREAIGKSLLQIDVLGWGYWCGYSFSWMSCMAARVGQVEKARHMLETFLHATVSRNGFHLNGDFKNLGVGAWKYRPFTLEGNFAAAQAVHEMLLQSWGGKLRLFPAVSSAWRDVSFENLRAEGAFRVWAQRRGGRTVRLRIAAEVDGLLRLADPFGGGKARWNLKGLKRVEGGYELPMRAGQVLTGEAKA